MGFLDFFKKKQILVSTEDDKIMQNLPEIKKEDFVDESNPLDKGNTRSEEHTSELQSR